MSKDGNARLVTLTTDPDYDSPAVLKRYGERYGADFNRWTFLTGTKAQIAGLAGDSLKLSAVPVPEKDLPVELPRDVTFDKPGNPLDRHPHWKHVPCPSCGKAARRTSRCRSATCHMDSTGLTGRL